MPTCPFCNPGATEQPSTKRPPHFLHRIWQTIQWLFPAALLALMPKCPLCVAAYIALFTGVGISVSTAHWIQILMVILCLSSLAYLTTRLALRLRKRTHGA